MGVAGEIQSLRKSAHGGESQCIAKMVARGSEGKKLRGGLQCSGEVRFGNWRWEVGGGSL